MNNALMCIRKAYNDALKLELSELETIKNAIEDKIGDVKGKLVGWGYCDTHTH